MNFKEMLDKLSMLSESEERSYVCVHAKKGKHECKASSSYEAAKKAAQHWGLKSTAGIDAHLADVEHKAVDESTLSEETKETAKGRVHTAEPGGYGRKMDTDEEGEEIKKDEPQVKRGRGRPKKGADIEGNVKKYDAEKLTKAMGGGKAPKDKTKPSTKHTLKDWIEEIEGKYIAEAVPAGMKPMAILDPKNQSAGTGVITSSNPDIQKMLGSLDPQDTKIVMTTQTEKPAATTAQPAAGATGQAPAGTTQVKEKWGTETKVSPEEKGKYKGKSKEELTKAYNALKAKGPHKKGSPEFGRMRELAFAIRAKSDWGKVQEAEVNTSNKLVGGPNYSANVDRLLKSQPTLSSNVNQANEFIQQSKSEGLANVLSHIGAYADDPEWYEKSLSRGGDAEDHADFLLRGANVNLTDPNLRTGIKLIKTILHKLYTQHEQNSQEKEMKESGLQAYLGNKKYGKEGMDALRKAGREGASKEKMAQIRAKHDKLSEADRPSDQVDMGAGLGAGRSQTTFEAKEDKKAEKKDHKAEKLGKKVTNAAEKMEEAAKDAKTDKKKVKESMEHRLTAARLEGKAHGLKGHAYHGKSYEDMEEARMYHEGFKEGLDECYGIMPVRGVVDETSLPATTPGMASAAEPTMEGSRMTGPLEKAADWAESKGYMVTKGPNNSINFLYPDPMRRGNQPILMMNAYAYEDEDLGETWVNWQSGAMSGADPLPVFMGVLKDEHEELMYTLKDEMARHKEEFAEDDMFEMDKSEWMQHKAKTTPGDTFTAFGQTMKDKDVLEADALAFESLDKQLNALLTESEQVDEGMSVSISKGQEGSPDSVSVTAQDGEADKLLSFIKQAGLGLFGDNGPASNYGAPEGESSVDHGGIKVVGDHDGMMGLMKKLSGIGQSEPAQDYEDEEKHGDMGHDHEEGDAGPEMCSECGTAMEEGHACDSKEMVDEVETDDQRLAQVAEDNPPDSDEPMTAADENAEAEEDATKPAAGGATNESVVTEWANDAGQSLEEFREETFEADMDFMMNVISGGLNKKKVTGQQTIPVLAGDEERTHDPLEDVKKLSGVK